jgi:hypothetical protein
MTTSPDPASDLPDPAPGATHYIGPDSARLEEPTDPDTEPEGKKAPSSSSTSSSSSSSSAGDKKT